LLAEGQQSPFGEKLLEATGRSNIPTQGDLEATAEVWTEGLIVKPRQGRTVYLPYTEARGIRTENYRVEVSTETGPITLQALGAKYDNFALRLTDAWAESLANALLMDESVTIYESRARYSLDNGTAQSTGTCRARIQPASLLLLFNNNPPIRIPYSMLKSYSSEAYTIKLQSQVAIELSQMGQNQKYFYEKLTGAIRAVEQDSLDTVRQQIPTLGFVQLQSAAQLMDEGKAAKRKNLDRISPDCWTILERQIAQSSLSESYGRLITIGLPILAATGFHKTVDNVYIWFVVPILGTPITGGNTLAMEIVSETGHATYLYWIVPRSKFATTSPETFNQEADRMIDIINDAMIASSFRREPIYLTDEQLETASYSKYLFAAKNLEPLKFLREHYYARIIHSTPEQWKNDLTEALLFNTGANDDHLRWSKTDDQPTELGSRTVASVEAGPVMTVINASDQLSPAILASHTATVPGPPVSDSQPLILTSQNSQTMSQPVLTNATERSLVVDRIESHQEGKVKLWLNDPEFDHQIPVVMKAEDASRLAAFPGSKVKLSLQKT
jgi:hypothetical protein